MKNLIDDLKMDHLKLDDLAQRVNPTVSHIPAPAVADPRDKPEYTFEFSYTDARGGKWTGTFVNHILTIGDTHRRGLLKAQLGQNMPDAALDGDAKLLNHILSHLAISLKDKPDWANDLLSLYDQGLLLAIYDKVLDHEDFFFRRSPDQKPGSQSGEGAGA